MSGDVGMESNFLKSLADEMSKVMAENDASFLANSVPNLELLSKIFSNVKRDYFP